MAKKADIFEKILSSVRQKSDGTRSKQEAEKGAVREWRVRTNTQRNVSGRCGRKRSRKSIPCSPTERRHRSSCEKKKMKSSYPKSQKSTSTQKKKSRCGTKRMKSSCGNKKRRKMKRATDPACNSMYT